MHKVIRGQTVAAFKKGSMMTVPTAYCYYYHYYYYYYYYYLH